MISVAFSALDVLDLDLFETDNVAHVFHREVVSDALMGLTEYVRPVRRVSGRRHQELCRSFVRGVYEAVR
jgi:hypothetical protein